MNQRWIGFAVLIAVLVGGGVLAANRIGASLHVERLRSTIERELTEILGLDVEITGAVRIDLFPEIQLEIEDVRIANLPGRPSPHLLEVRLIALELRIFPFLRGMFVIDVLEFYDADLTIEPDEHGAWSLNPRLEEMDERPASNGGDPVTLAIHGLTIHDLEVYFDRFSEENVQTLSVKELTVESTDLASPLSIEGHGTVEGGTFAIKARTGSLQEFLAATGPFPLDLQARLFDGAIDATGTLGNPRTLEGMNLRVQLELKDIARAAHELGFHAPPLGSISTSGVLVERDGLIGIEALTATSDRDGPLRLELEGSVRDIMQVEGVDLHLRVAVPDVDSFKNLTSLSLPGVPMHAEFEMDDDDGSLGVEADAEITRPGMFEFTAEGVLGDLRRLKELDVRVGFETETLDAISDAIIGDLEWDSPDLGPLEATAHLIINDGSLGLDRVDVRLGDSSLLQARMTGSVGNLMGTRDVELEAQVRAESASRLASLFGREIPEIGGLDASLSLRDEDGTLGIENATLEVGRGDPFRLSLAGTFDDLFNLQEILFKVTIEARDLALIGKIAGIDLPAVGPVTFSGDVRGSAESLISHGELRLNRTVLDGDFAFTLPSEGRPTTHIRIESPRVHLPDLLVASGLMNSRLEARRPERFTLEKWWHGDQPLPIDQLRAFDGELSFEADRITGYELLDLQNFRVLARLAGGHLILEEFGAEYEQGKFSGQFELDARLPSPTASLQIEAFNVDLTRMMSQVQGQSDYAGLLDLSIKLETSGRTAPEARSNLNGFFGAMLRDGVLVNEYSKAFTFDVLHVSIPSFFAKPKNTEPAVYCFLAILPIEDGIAEVDQLYLEGKEITITGVGQIDLARDEFNLHLTPHLHAPGLMSIAATVEVTGPIEDPILRPKPRSMLSSAFGALYRNAIRPLSALDRVTRGRAQSARDETEDPCGLVARQRIVRLESDAVEQPE